MRLFKTKILETSFYESVRTRPLPDRRVKLPRLFNRTFLLSDFIKVNFNPPLSRIAQIYVCPLQTALCLPIVLGRLT